MSIGSYILILKSYLTSDAIEILLGKAGVCKFGASQDLPCPAECGDPDRLIIILNYCQ